MESLDVFVLLPLAAIVIWPLWREWSDLRRSFGLSRLGALAVTSLVLPSFVVATVLSLPLAAHPAAQWLTIVGTTLVLYSFAARATAASAASAETAPSRSTRG